MSGVHGFTPCLGGALPHPGCHIGKQHIARQCQRRFIDQLIAETHTDAEQLLAYFGFASLDSIPKAEASRVIKALESKRRAA